MAHGRAEELTGRRRYRQMQGDWDNSPDVFVLQVEVSVFNTVREGRPGRWVCEWRDARRPDIAEGELCG